jgi:putative Mg2+ transporter-C (MgtC) family protein
MRVLAAVAAGQGWAQIGGLALAFALSSIIGLERELRHKSAGLRTHTLVGVGAALFVLVGKHGFADVKTGGAVVLDPSRVAAQVVSGIGFIGGGLIFVRGDLVRGLTTAAIVWMTAAVGMACGSGLAVLAIAVTGGHFLVVLGYTHLERRMRRFPGQDAALRVTYVDGRDLLADILAECERRRVVITRMETDRASRDGLPALTLYARDLGSVGDLVLSLDRLDGVLAVAAGSLNGTD